MIKVVLELKNLTKPLIIYGNPTVSLVLYNHVPFPQHLFLSLRLLLGIYRSF